MPQIWQGVLIAKRAYERGMTGTMGRQLMLTAPLVSSVHLSRPPQQQQQPQPQSAQPQQVTPWALRPASSRPWLMSYGGSTEGFPKAAALRKLLVQKCSAYGNTTCRLVTRYRMSDADALLEAFRSKRESVFCLEPPGFGFHRKSQVQPCSLYPGCNPPHAVGMVLAGRRADPWLHPRALHA